VTAAAQLQVLATTLHPTGPAGKHPPLTGLPGGIFSRRIVLARLLLRALPASGRADA